MSWFTDEPTPLAAGLARATSLLARAGADDGGRAPHRPWVPTSWADLAPDGSAVASDDPSTRLPALQFDETDLVRVASAVARDAARDARAACADDAATSQALVQARLADTLSAALRARQDDETRCLRQVIDLAEAIVRALSVDADGRRAALLEALTAMLTMLPSEPVARVAVASDAVPMLRAALPQLAARLAFAGVLEVVGEARLPAGAVQVTWPGGWLEHAPHLIEQRLAQILAAGRSALAAPAGGTTPAPIPGTDDGDEHDHD
jgi:hypothetical protein